MQPALSAARPAGPRAPERSDYEVAEILGRLRELHNQPWREQAACASEQVPAWWFFPAREWPQRWAVRQARLVCAFCPVRVPCMREALSHDLPGIYAGLTRAERQQVRRENRGDGVAPGLELARKLATTGPWRIVHAAEWPKLRFHLGPGPGRGRKGPIALYAEEHRVSRMTAWRRLRTVP